MNNATFANTMEKVRKHRDMKLVTTETRRNYLVSEPNYHTKKAIEIKKRKTKQKKTQTKMNILVYLGLLILELSKTVTQQFWYVSLYA